MHDMHIKIKKTIANCWNIFHKAHFVLTAEADILSQGGDLIIYLLAIRKNKISKLMWWLYKIYYDTMYYNDVVRYSSSDVTSGTLQV